MVNGGPAEPQTAIYGRRSFMSALLNVLIVELAIWMTVPYLLLTIYLTPLILLDAVVAVILKTRGGSLGQIGRGMLIGLLCVPAGLVVLLLPFLVADQAGLL